MKPLDIIFTQSDSFVSKGIRKFTRHKGERPSWASHTAISLVPPMISEAVAEGIKTNHISSIKGPAIAFRIPGMTARDYAAGVNTALNDTGKPYPYVKVFGLKLIDRIFFHGHPRAVRWAVSGNRYCDGHAAKALRSTDNPLAMVPYDLDEGSPDDFMDWCVRRGYPVVWHQGNALETAREVYPEIIVQ